MRIFNSPDDPELAAMVRRGAVGILPTDTLYGLVASAHEPRAVQRLYELKQREQKPGTTIAASIGQLGELGLNLRQLQQVAHLWPASLSIIMPSPLEHVHQGRGDSPFRVVADSPLRKLLEQTGPLTTSSANPPSLPPATSLAQAQAYFGDQVDFYVDGGEIGERPPSTIIRLLEDGGIEVIRRGAVEVDDKQEIRGNK